MYLAFALISFVAINTTGSSFWLKSSLIWDKVNTVPFNTLLYTQIATVLSETIISLPQGCTNDWPRLFVSLRIINGISLSAIHSSIRLFQFVSTSTSIRGLLGELRHNIPISLIFIRISSPTKSFVGIHFSDCLYDVGCPDIRNCIARLGGYLQLYILPSW